MVAKADETVFSFSGQKACFSGSFGLGEAMIGLRIYERYHQLDKKNDASNIILVILFINSFKLQGLYPTANGKHS